MGSSDLMERRESGENSLRDRFDDEEFSPLVIQSWLEHQSRDQGRRHVNKVLIAQVELRFEFSI